MITAEKISSLINEMRTELRELEDILKKRTGWKEEKSAEAAHELINAVFEELKNLLRKEGEK